MTEETISIAAVECQRLMQKIADLRKEMHEPQTDWLKGIKPDRRIYLSDCPKQTGALRRASLDLTRALADMRRPG